MSSLIMLRPGRNASFRRSVRKTTKDKKTGEQKTEIVKELVFHPGRYLELNAREMAAVEKDLNNGVLVEVETDEKGRPRIPIDASSEAGPIISALEEKVEQLKSENQSLKAELAKLSEGSSDNSGGSGPGGDDE